MRARKEMSAIYHVTVTDTWSVSSVYSYVDNEAHLSRFLLYNFLSRRVAKDAHILKSSFLTILSYHRFFLLSLEQFRI